MIVNQMTSIRVNFLIAFENRYGRKPVATRQDLIAFQREWKDGEVGGCGMPLRYPSWLTNPKPNPFKVGRAAFRLPWDELDAWNALVSSQSTPVKQDAIPAAASTPPVAEAIEMAIDPIENVETIDMNLESVS